MKTFLRIFFLIIFFFFPGVLCAAEPETGPPLAQASRVDAEYTVSVIPFYGPEKIWALYTPFVDYLKESTGKPWTLKLFPTHETLIDSLCQGKIAMSLLGPVPLAKVMAKCNAEPLVVALNKDGAPTYRSIFVTTDPAVTSLQGLKGKWVGFFKGSTVAHILPRQILRQAGLAKEDITPLFLEGQDHIVNSLLSRQVAAAGLKETLYNKFKDQGLRVLATSDPLPNFAFAASPQASMASRKLFADTLLRLAPASNESDRKRMEKWDDEIRNGFVPATDVFRASVKELLVITDEIMREDR